MKPWPKFNWWFSVCLIQKNSYPHFPSTDRHDLSGPILGLVSCSLKYRYHHLTWIAVTQSSPLSHLLFLRLLLMDCGRTSERWTPFEVDDNRRHHLCEWIIMSSSVGRWKNRIFKVRHCVPFRSYFSFVTIVTCEQWKHTRIKSACAPFLESLPRGAVSQVNGRSKRRV